MAGTKKNIIKKIVYILLGIVLLLVLAAAIIPFVIDVDKYRPTLVRMANQRLEAKLEVGKLSLSLWGRILVKIDGIKIIEKNGNDFLKVSQAQLHLPIWPLIEGKPRVYFEMKKPAIWLAKKPDGKFNFQSLMKDGRGLGRVVPPPPGSPVKKPKSASPSGAGETQAMGSAAAPTTQQPGQAQEQGSSSTTTPPAPVSRGIVKAPDSGDRPIPWSQRFSLISLGTHARLGLRFFDTSIYYNDAASGFKTKVDGLNWEIKELSLTRPTESRIWGDLDARLAKEMSSKGSFEIFVKLVPQFEGNNLKSAKGAIVLEASDLDLRYSNLFAKPKGTKFRSEIGLIGSPEEIVLSKAQFWFHEAHFVLEGRVKTTDGYPADLKFSLKPIEIAKWNQILPPLSSYGISGQVGVEGIVQTSQSEKKYNASVSAKKISFKLPYVKSNPNVDAQLEIQNNRLDIVTTRIAAGKSAIDLNGSVTDFEKPVVQLKGTSSGLYLDELIDFEALEKEKSAVIDWFSPASAYAAQPATEDYDLMISEVKKNPYFLKTALNGDLKIRELVSMGYQLSDVVTLFSLRNGVSEFQKLDFNVYGGKISTRAKVDLKPQRPGYGFVSTVEALDMETAVKQNAETFKNTAYGKLNLSIKGTGSSFNPELAKQNLNVTGSMSIADAKFTSIDVGQMATEAINKSIQRLGSKIPQIKGKQIKGLPKGYSSYKKIASDYSIKGGKFIAPNFVAEAKPNRGIDLKGYTEFGIIDKRIKAKWIVIDRFNLLKAKDLSVKVAGIDIDEILADGNPPVVSFPVTVSGTLEDPKYSYEEIPKHFSNIALKKVKKGTSKGLKQKAKKKILEHKAVKKAPKKVKDLLKKIF